MPKVLVTIYKITGKQLFFDVPSAWCEECDLSVHTLRKVMKKLPRGSVELIIKPWTDHAIEALSKGGWHAPVVMIGKTIFSQGIVPDEKKLEGAIRDAISRERDHSRTE